MGILIILLIYIVTNGYYSNNKYDYVTLYSLFHVICIELYTTANYRLIYVVGDDIRTPDVTIVSFDD